MHPIYMRQIHIFILITTSRSTVLLLILKNMLPILQVINIDSVKHMVILLITHTPTLMQVFILLLILVLDILHMDMYRKENYEILFTILLVLDMHHQLVPEDYLSILIFMLANYQKATQASKSIHQKIKLSNLRLHKIKHKLSKLHKRVHLRLLYSSQPRKNL